MKRPSIEELRELLQKRIEKQAALPKFYVRHKRRPAKRRDEEWTIPERPEAA